MKFPQSGCDVSHCLYLLKYFFYQLNYVQTWNILICFCISTPDSFSQILEMLYLVLWKSYNLITGLFDINVKLPFLFVVEFITDHTMNSAVLLLGLHLLLVMPLLLGSIYFRSFFINYNMVQSIKNTKFFQNLFILWQIPF